MKPSNTPAAPPSLPLPILPPRENWPALLRLAADVLQKIADAEGGFRTLSNELRLIADCLEVRS